jgi:uncharacterized membrane protein
MDNTAKDAAKRQVMVFGLAGLVIFGSAAGLALWRQSVWGQAFFGALFIIMVLFSALPGPMTPLYRLWLAAALFIGRIVNAVILALLYIFLITPLALARRLLRSKKPLLPSGPDPAAQSYWKPRQNPAQEKSRFTRRY